MPDEIDAELAQVQARIRSHTRRDRVAKGIGVAITGVFLVLGLALSFALQSGLFFYAMLGIGGVLGGLFWQFTAPRDSIDDL